MADAAQAAAPMRDQVLQSINAALGTWNQILVFVFAALVILVFVADRYNRPTYSKERDGFVALIAPRFLTSDVRYAQGLRIYAGIILLFYVFLVIAGKKVAAAILPADVLSGDPLFFPLAIALFIIGLSSAEDKGLFGSLELHIRRFAHQRAYIPNGTRLLARRIAQDYFGTWQIPAQTSVIKELMQLIPLPAESDSTETPQVGGGNPKDAAAEAGKLAAGKLDIKALMKKYSGLSDYQRAGTIFRDICNTIASSPHRSRFVSYEDLGDLKVAVREFRQTNDGAAQFRNYYSLCRIGMALKDAKDFGLIAPDFAEELASTIADVKSRCEGLQREVKERAAGSSGKDVTDLLKQKNTDIVKLRNDLSIILAGALMRSRPSDSQLAAVLDQIGLEDEGVPMRRSWLPCIGLVLGALTITSMIYLIGFAIFGEWLLGWPGRLMASSGSPLRRLVEFLGTLIGRDLPPQGGLPDVAGSILRNMAFALCSATVLYTLTAIVGYSVREHLLDDGEWRENAFTRVKSAFQVCVTTVPLSIVFNFLALSPNPGFFWIISNVTVSASISIVASIFFFRHIKSAASAPLKFERDGGARPRRFLGIGLRSWAVALCHGCIAFVMLFSLTYVNSMSALVLQNQNILDDLRNQIVELADKQATYEKDVSDKVVDLPAGYTRLIESYRKGQIENQLAGLEQGNFSSLAIFSGNGGERNFNKQLELLRSMCDFIVSGPVTDFSGPPKKANANSCYGGLAASLVIDEEPTEGWRNVLRSLATDLGFGEKFRPKLNGRLPTFAAAEKVSSTFATLDWNYEYLAKFYTLLKNFNYGGAVVAATSGAALAFMFSVIIVVGRRYEIDDFYSGLTRLGRVRLNRRMNEAGWNVDGRGPEEQFSQSLANPRSQLFEISIQEAMMSEGSYLRLQDQFWLASKNPDRSGDARGGPPKPEGAAQT